MDKYQANRLLSTMSNIPLLGERINLVRDILQCPSCIFATSSRSEFTEHLVSHCTPKQRSDSNVKAPLNADGCSSFAVMEPKAEETCRANLQSRRDRGFREAKRCKQCNFVAGTKMEYWEHMRCHIKGFTCSECSFVTKYKHHMNHHWLSVHDGSKPFKCKKCLYTCVSKSMLTSHLKKHSNIYPYRCADCTYKSKFCNTLKKHLRKKEHQPAMVLNADGSPNPLSIIDVYGTKRGRRPAKEERNSTVTITTNDQIGDSLSLDSPVARYLTVATTNDWINESSTNKSQFPYSDLVAAFNLSSHVSLGEDVAENMRRMEQSGTLTEMLVRNALQAECNEVSKHHLSDSKTTELEYQKRRITESTTDAPLDLRIAEVIQENQLQFRALARIGANSPKVTGTSKRKGKAIKLEREQNEGMSFDSDGFRQVNPRVEDIKVADLFDADLICHYCEIIFGNVIMYAMHMGCHNFNDPYTCNICGQECIDKLSFFLHIARSEH
ncbi:PREDICTED: protein hunchback-like [Vollenhovia emeryi]|uniref:protein hunchback-like n=1 Tax=Vollenhovia emeryi TaxID=411798 RepID=UPI0005F42E22|nr:PREDICTED: protein hunchback-like [Vollenhovia emeryi]